MSNEEIQILALQRFWAGLGRRSYVAEGIRWSIGTDEGASRCLTTPYHSMGPAMRRRCLHTITPTRGRRYSYGL